MWLLIVLPIVGAVVMTAVRQLQDSAIPGDRKGRAAAVRAGGDACRHPAGLRRPDRRDEAEQNLAARSGPLRQVPQRRRRHRNGRRDARRDGGRRVEQHRPEFSTNGTDRAQANAIANAVARAYPEWRADAYGRTIDAAIEQIQAQTRRRLGEHCARGAAPASQCAEDAQLGRHRDRRDGGWRRADVAAPDPRRGARRGHRLRDRAARRGPARAARHPRPQRGRCRGGDRRPGALDDPDDSEALAYEGGDGGSRFADSYKLWPRTSRRSSRARSGRPMWP